jgi:hypothetical protein
MMGREQICEGERGQGREKRFTCFVRHHACESGASGTVSHSVTLWSVLPSQMFVNTSFAATYLTRVIKTSSPQKRSFQPRKLSNMDHHIPAEDKVSTDNFNDRVQALPPELFSMVYDYTFDLNIASEITVDKFFRMPHQVQVDCRSRRFYSRKYCGQNKFYVDGSDFTLRRWLLSMAQEHRALVREVRFRMIPPGNDEDDDTDEVLELLRRMYELQCRLFQ